MNWYPGHIKWGRFGEWLRNVQDWAISRERYWGTPIPFWQCDSCEKYECIGSIAEIRSKKAVRGISEPLDLHRPNVDEIYYECGDCGGTMSRILEVMDVWFDSGAMPIAQWHYPFENDGMREDGRFPADYICEAVDQTRGWFYSLHAVSSLVFGEPCYRNVICLGHILDEAGEKMSKSKGNVVKPWSVLDAQGADALRWYLYTASPPGNPRRFSGELVQEAIRKFMLTLWNTYSFFVTYANIDGYQPNGSRNGARASGLDRWIESELHRLVKDVTDSLDNYDPTNAGRRIEAFVDVLSNWYVRRSRRRFWKSENDEEKQSAYDTLYSCLVTLSKLIAPFTPFLAEELYRNLVSEIDAEAPESVHLASFPEADESLIDPALNDEARLAMKISSLGRAARSKAAIKVRQPLASVKVVLRRDGERAALQRSFDQVGEELNVKALEFAESASEVYDYKVSANTPLLGPKYGKDTPKIVKGLSEMEPGKVAQDVQSGHSIEVAGFTLEPEEVNLQAVEKDGVSVASEGDYVVAVPTVVSDELAKEGMARELVHRLQTMRRSAGFEVVDQIVSYMVGDGAPAEALAAHESYIKQETLSQEVLTIAPPAKAFVETHKLDGREVVLGVVKVG